MATLTDNYSNEDYVNELIGSEVTGGELISDDIQSGNILDFDGVNDKIDAGTSSDYDFGAMAGFTVSFWMIPHSISSQRGMIGRYGGAFSPGLAIDQRSNGRFSIWFRNNVAPYGGWYDSPNNTLVANTKYHVVVTCDWSNLIIYLNGEEAVNHTLTNSIASIPSQTLWIASETGTNRYFDGPLWAVRIHSEAFTASEVRDLYTSDESDDTNLEGHWKLDEGSGTTATDSSSNGNDGTITGATWTGGTSYNRQNRTTSEDLLTGNSTLNDFKFTAAKKAGGTNGRVLFSDDGTNYKNDEDVTIGYGAYQFDGTNDYIGSFSSLGTVNTIMFRARFLDATSRSIIDIDGTDRIEINASSQIVATSFPAATVYVDGIEIDNKFYKVIKVHDIVMVL